MDSFETVTTTSIPSNIKSASFFNILPFIFLYILKNHGRAEDVKCDSDRLYKYIPNKKKSLHPNLKYILLLIPICILLFKSQNNISLEHTLVILSYAIAIKTSMHFMTPCLAKQEFIHIISIVLFLNLRYFNIIPQGNNEVVWVSIAYSLFFVLTRETTTANIISDYTIALLSFILPKYLG